MTPEEDDAYCKRRAAVHEAGHATVAAIKGARVRAEVGKAGTGGAGIPGGRFDASMAIAGMIAVLITYEYANVNADWFIDNWAYCRDELSERDLARIPDDVEGQRAAAGEALSILRSQKPLFDELVRQLVQVDNLTVEMVAELTAEFRTDR